MGQAARDVLASWRNAEPFLALAAIVCLASFALGLLSPEVGDAVNRPASANAVAAWIKAATGAAVAGAGARGDGMNGWVGLSDPALGKMSLRGTLTGEPRQMAAAPAPRASIAIVIDDLGFASALMEQIDALPPAVTLAFLPDSEESARQAAASRQAGHEIILHMPMEAEGVRAASRYALKVGQSEAEMRSQLNEALARVPGAIGVNNHQGSRFTADVISVGRFMKVLGGTGLIFLDSRTTAGSLAARASFLSGLPTAERHVFLDHKAAGEAEVAASLAHAEEAALREGSLVVIGHPHEATLSVLARWAEKAPARGFELVSLSEHVRRMRDRGGDGTLIAAGPSGASY